MAPIEIRSSAAASAAAADYASEGPGQQNVQTQPTETLPDTTAAGANSGPTQTISSRATADIQPRLPTQTPPGIAAHPQAVSFTNPTMQLGATYLPSGPIPPLSFTREQLDARFALEQRRFEADLAAIKAKTARENEESRARIAVIQAGAVMAAAPRTQVDDEEPIGEISQATLLVASRYPGLPKAKIARIFANKFRPKNLYRLRHLKGREDKDREENVTIENGQIKLKRVTGTLRDFGTSWDIWSKSFINYAIIMVDFFGASSPTLFRVLLLFHTRIRKLSKIYEWQGAILSLAIDYHTDITSNDHTDADAWTLPQDWIDQYCLPHNVLPNNSSSKKRPAASSPEGHTGKKKTLEVCRNFNTKGCSFGEDCVREHKCSDCSSKEHKAHICTAKRKQ